MIRDRIAFMNNVSGEKQTLVTIVKFNLQNDTVIVQGKLLCQSDNNETVRLERYMGFDLHFLFTGAIVLPKDFKILCVNNTKITDNI